MNELNREQIIKALECCTKSTLCARCPRGDYDTCDIEAEALSLINELTVEVADLKAIAEGYRKQFEDCYEENERLRAEGEWLPQFEGARILKCSVCGYEYCDLIECGNYCGNCGAKMKGGE